MDTITKNIYKDAIAKWGSSAQTDMFVEEVGEVLTALNHFRRNRIGIDVVRNELADLTIMLEQLTVMYGEDVINKFKAEKLARLKKRLENED